MDITRVGPDGSTVDSAGGLWCALVGGGQLARFTGRNEPRFRLTR